MIGRARRPGSSPALRAFGAYLALSLVATWPLVTGLARDVAWDLGDSLLNMWILAWDCEQLLAILRGDVARAATFFDANIFHPAPLTLAYSEHLIAQAIQILPVYAVTQNPILCYNLLFISTFALSGLGMFLLVRELTGNPLAAFVAGLLFAFAPYRLAQSSHLQVLSSQWMPFALYGLRRYFDSGRLRPLLGAAFATAAQGLSCGYYLLYFSPFVAVYALWEIGARGLWKHRRAWVHLAAAGLLAAAVITPFVLPYAAVRERFDMARRRTEVVRLSADVYSYATAFAAQPLWGQRMDAFPKAEGELFPGMVPVLLALVGVLAFRLKAEATEANPGLRLEAEDSSRRGFRLQAEGTSRGRRLAVALLAALAIVHAALALVTLLVRRMVTGLGPVEIRISNISQLLLRAAIAFGLVLALSPAARRHTAAFFRARGFFVIGLVAAAWFSLGPTPQALGRSLDLAGPYGWLYDYVPGFEGLRVPARFGMIVAFMLAVLGGYGAAALLRWSAGRTVVVAVAVAFLFEGTMVPFVVNGMSPERGFNLPDARVYRPARAPRIYTEGVRAADVAVLAELPLGYPTFDLRAVYYSTVHWRRILNGYSGFFPPHYARLAFMLSELPRHPDASIQALREAGATHVLVHEGAYLGNEGEETSAALRTRGARELYRDGADVLLEIPR